jgi:hypothetical protein
VLRKTLNTSRLQKCESNKLKKKDNSLV